MLENTLVVWMGEFCRTPKYEDDAGGRNHYSEGWLVGLSGGGVKMGQVIGATDADNVKVTDRPIGVQDLFVTFCHVLGLEPARRILHRAEPAAEAGRRWRGDQGVVLEVWGGRGSCRAVGFQTQRLRGSVALPTRRLFHDLAHAAFDHAADVVELEVVLVVAEGVFDLFGNHFDAEHEIA